MMTIRLGSGSLTISGTPLPIYNQALQHSGVPVLIGLTASCRGLDSYPGGELIVRVAEPSAKWVIPIPELSPGSQIQLDLNPSNIPTAGLEFIRQSIKTYISVELGPEKYECEVVLTAPWHWPLDTGARTALASYVLPHEATVRSFVARTEERLLASKRSTPENILDSPENWTRCLYEHLSGGAHYDYRNPRVLEISTASSYQIIRPPHDLRHRSTPVSATCLDLSLLVASCMEGAGIAPLVYLCGSHPERLTHAMVGAWTSKRGGFKPRIRNIRQLLEAVSSGEAFVLEATGLCRDRALSFTEAKTRGTERLMEAAYVEALDIGASRPPIGKVEPLGLALDPTLAHAQLESARLAARLGTRLVETLHLVHGVLVASGDFTEALFQRCGADADQIRDEIEKRLRSIPVRRTSASSKGLERCLGDAQLNAKERGSSVIRESDLWWAFAEISPSFSAILSATDSSAQDFRRVLAEMSPNNREGSTMGEYY